MTAASIPHGLSGRLFAPATTPPAAAARVAGRTAADLLREARPVVLVAFLLRFVSTAGLFGHPTGTAVLAAASWAMLTTAVYVFNGISDRTGDRVNGSTRPIASGRLSTRTARRCVLGLVVCGGIGCGMASPVLLPVAGAFVLFGWAYSAGPTFKSSAVALPITIVVGLGLTYLAGWLVGPRDATSLEFGLAMAAWSACTCSAKDFSDIAGDRAAGRRTLPLVLGARRASLLVGAATALAATAFVAFGFCDLATTPILLLSALVAFGGSVEVVRRSCFRQARTGPGRGPYRAFMAAQYLTHGAFVTLSCCY